MDHMQKHSLQENGESKMQLLASAIASHLFDCPRGTTINNYVGNKCKRCLLHWMTVYETSTSLRLVHRLRTTTNTAISKTCGEKNNEQNVTNKIALAVYSWRAGAIPRYGTQIHSSFELDTLLLVPRRFIVKKSCGYLAVIPAKSVLPES